VRGTVLAPAAARVEPGDPFRIEVDASALDLQIELQVEPAQAVAGAARTTVTLPGAAPMDFVTIPPGTYLRGSPATETGRDAKPNQGHIGHTSGRTTSNRRTARKP